MAVLLTTSPGALELDMGKRPKDPDQPERGRPPIGKQIGVRIHPELLADLELISEVTGNDLSAVIRLILSENAAPYIQRARDTARNRLAARGEEAPDEG